MQTEPNTICGGCLCGAIRYEGIGEPYNVTRCHREDCCKERRCPVRDLGFVSAQRFSIYEGKPVEIAWAGCIRSFCGACGSGFTFMSEPMQTKSMSPLPLSIILKS